MPYLPGVRVCVWLSMIRLISPTLKGLDPFAYRSFAPKD
jgi:hypothetical protein